TDEKILKAVSLRWGVPYLLSLESELQPGVGQWLPEPMARKHLVVPILKSEDSLTLGMVNPLDVPAIDDVSAFTGLHVRPVMVPLPTMSDAVQKVYGADNGRAAAPDAKALADDRTVEIITALLQEGIARKASDIHFEPAEKETRVRFRVDGMLQAGKSFP